MRAITIDDEFGLQNLRVCRRDSPTPGPGELKLAMSCVSLNYRDLLMVNGLYNPRQPLPLIPCSDGVGRVVDVGPGVDRERWMGRRVAPIFAQGWRAGEPTKDKLKTTLGGPLDGVLREEMVVSAESVVDVPEHLSDAEAATLPCAAVTAWNALVEQGGVTAGDRVLTLGTGGVSIFAVQFASMLGAHVIATSSKDEKLARVAELGAAEGINYREDRQWGKTVKRLTDGRGVDLVVEVGGAGTLEQSVKAVRIGGQISLIGVLAGGIQEFNVIPILMQNIRIQGVIVGHREMFERMNRAIEVAQMRPVVDRVFAFDEAKDAFEYMAGGSHFGKICIAVAE
jgi:NADPH:quinone reductase-like Zn-dependent oxidoreductase